MSRPHYLLSIRIVSIQQPTGRSVLANQKPDLLVLWADFISVWWIIFFTGYRSHTCHRYSISEDLSDVCAYLGVYERERATEIVAFTLTILSFIFEPTQSILPPAATENRTRSQKVNSIIIICATTNGNGCR